jgi:hypothetical protein
VILGLQSITYPFSAKDVLAKHHRTHLAGLVRVRQTPIRGRPANAPY